MAGKKIVMAPTDVVNAPNVTKNVDRLLVLIGKYMTDGDPQEWALECWVSDMSSFGDFALEDEELAEIGTILNLKLEHSDLLGDVAMKMSGN